jgi:hypothetical protein
MSGRTVLVTLMCALMAAEVTLAQPAPAPPPGGRAGGGGVGFGGGLGGGVAVQSVAQNRQRTLDAVKEQLGASDEEWTALSPKIEKLLHAKRAMQSGAGMSWTSTNGGAPVFRASSATTDTPVGKAMEAVRAGLEDKDVPAEEITKRLAALKEAREKARAALDAAQGELKRALTPRQEAVLQTLGLME